MSKQVIHFMDEALGHGQAVAMAVLTRSEAGTPGISGGMMAVAADSTHAGTVGGGASEAGLIQACMQALRKSGEGFPFALDLREDGGSGMVCGGAMEGFVTIVRPDCRLYVFGGGHVGRQAAAAGRVAGFDVTVVEDRPEMAEACPGAAVRITDSYAKEAAELPMDKNSYVVIVTRGHRHDLEVLRAVLRRETAYIGMIGSRKKVRGVLDTLREEGVAQQKLAAVYAPVGLDIDDGTPGQIAIAIVSEMLFVKNGGKLRHCREKMLGT